MKTENAIRIMLSLSGEYDIPGKFLIVFGHDAYGCAIEEKIPVVDDVALELEVKRKLSGL